MKVIDVKDQVRLSFRKCVELVLSGIRYRLFRAFITVTIICLAVAFLMTMVTESLTVRKVADELDVRMAPRRLFAFWYSRISSPLTQKDLTSELATATQGSPRWKEFKTWGGVTDEQLVRLAGVARRQLRYLIFFEVELEEGERRPMVGRTRGSDIFALLQDGGPFAKFEREFRMLGRQMHTDLDEFKTFLADWAQTDKPRKAILDGHRKALMELKKDLAGEDPKTALANADQALLRMLRSKGFELTEHQMQTVRVQASLTVDAEQLAPLVTTKLLRGRLKNRRNVKLSDVDVEMFFSEIRSTGGARWLMELNDDPNFQEQLRTQGLKPLKMSLERIREVASNKLEQRRLGEIVTSVSEVIGTGEGFLGYSSRTMWLIFVSFLVCVVGIANAMLMSVTDRFREIATMKCLGATDGYIMTNFILESCLQGTAGGIIGAFLGFVLGSLRSWVGYGWLAMENLPVSEIFAMAVLSIVAGVILSALAAVYPASIAARLAPMEAMRIE